MWRSLLLGKLAISIVISLLIGGYAIWSTRQPDLSTSEYSSWMGVGIFFLVLGLVQLAMVPLMFRKKKFDS
jgi:hypothetical protein